MEQDDLNSYNYDEVMSYVSRFADPYVEFNVETIDDLDNNRRFLVFNINEFEEKT